MRRLAAIMFTDMVGYTALMQDDESRATDVRDRHRAVLHNAVESNAGEIVQFYGDGTLSVFGSAIQAVNAAVTAQQALQAAPEIPVRIGLHIGDIVHDEDGVHGDGVNVAARIQGIATPGSVVVSTRVYEEIRNHAEFPTVSLGEVVLKNVRNPVAVFAIEAPGLAVPDPADFGDLAQATKRTIAVLPFVNMSADPENEFFSDGITEELINTLTKVQGLQVTARTSSFAFKNRNEDVRQIGRELGVSHLLEGSVRKAGDRIRITAQLIDTRDGYHVFSSVYDEVIEDVFRTQDEISQKITEELKATLPGVATPAKKVNRTIQDPEAYDKYLKALHHWNRWTPDDAGTAIELYTDAIRSDPDFAPAHAGLANAYVFLAAIGRMTCGSAYPRAKQAALRALELDSESSRSHTALGLVMLFYEWNFASAGACLRKAIELNPGSAEAHHGYALYLLAVGRMDELVEESEIAVGLDPLSPIMNESLGRAYLSAHRPLEASAQFQRTLELDPNFRGAVEGLAFTHLELGEFDEAVEEALRYRAMTPGGKSGHGATGAVLAAAGRTEEARQMLEELKERAKLEENTSREIDFTAIYMGLSEMDLAIEHLKRAGEERLGGIVFIRHGAMWDRLRADPRFPEVMQELGL